MSYLDDEEFLDILKTWNDISGHIQGSAKKADGDEGSFFFDGINNRTSARDIDWDTLTKYSFDDEIITEVGYAGDDGYGYGKVGNPPAKKKPAKADDVYLNQPIDYSTVGADQEDDDTHATRVTNNFSDGDELRDLEKAKQKAERQDRLAQKADVKGEADKSVFDELRKLRAEVRRLSQKMNPPSNDNKSY